ncbi:Cof-type HAD-IIB family hydrolase [Bacillus sp. 1P06AnD]|uniref:Cof-type HAD-IIB family hydrolase n=1 Tax=Bacillus sp. 1P06AnD TaxID=3132208 RepID=UPI0039A16D38
MDYRILFFDVDGTITKRDGSIPLSARTAIHRLKDRGFILVAATGRPLSLCTDIKALGIDTLITANGAYVKHKEQILHKVPLEKQQIKALMDFTSFHQHGLSFFTEELSMNGIENRDIANTLKETLSLDVYPSVDKRIFEKEVYLMCLYANEQSAELYTREFPHLRFERWHPFVLNVLEKEISKSLAIKHVLDYFDLEPAQAVAFGDGENDIDMLELSGLGIAMGNANEKVKSAADFVTKCVDEDGIEFALNHFGIL